MWLYKEEYNPEDWFGFVYIITNKSNNKKYIGKKYFFLNQKRKIGKKELALMEGKGRRPKYKTVRKESDWKTYWGSHKGLKEEVLALGEDNFSREIIRLCKSKRELTYYETKYQFLNEVLENPDQWYNDNIAGKYFSSHLSAFGD